MLLAIQMMKFFLQTGWGESARCIDGNLLFIMMGLCQGNGAAPTSWLVLVLSSLLVRILRKMEYGARVHAPISRVLLDIMGVLYVDDTDL